MKQVHEWRLSFRIAPGSTPALKALCDALARGSGAPVAPRFGEWQGNPRDFYSREVTVDATLGAGVSMRGRLGLQHTMVPPDPDLEHDDFKTPSLTLHGGDSEALDETWHRIADALGSAGYQDQTLAETPRSIVEHLDASGRTGRSAALRSAITDALVAKLRAQPAHGPVVIAFTCPDDIDRVLRAAPAPGRVRTVVLMACGLTEVPEALTIFESLEDLDLSDNRLTRLGTVPGRLSRLTSLRLADNPIARVDASELAGCASLRTLDLTRTAVRGVPPLGGVKVIGP